MVESRVDRAVFGIVANPPEAGLTWICARTDLDLAAEPAARRQLMAICCAVTAGGWLLVEIGAGHFVDVRGLQLLLDANSSVRGQDGRLVVVTPSPGFRRVVQIMQLDGELLLVPTVAEAFRVLGRTATAAPTLTA